MSKEKAKISNRGRKKERNWTIKILTEEVEKPHQPIGEVWTVKPRPEKKTKIIKYKLYVMVKKRKEIEVETIKLTFYQDWNTFKKKREQLTNEKKYAKKLQQQSKLTISKAKTGESL